VLDVVVVVSLVAALICAGVAVVLASQRDIGELAVPVGAALALVVVAAASATVSDKVRTRSDDIEQSSSGEGDDEQTASPDRPPFDHPVKISVTSEGFKGKARLHSGPLPSSLCLMGFFDRGKSIDAQERSYKFWTRCEEGKSFTTIKMVRRRLALRPAWGKRNAQAVARIEAGTPLTYLSGKTRRKKKYAGGGTQTRILSFDPDWVTQIRCAADEREGAHVQWTDCQRRDGDAPDLYTAVNP